MMEITRISLSRVQRQSGARDLYKPAVASIAASMKEIGQLTPIFVRAANIPIKGVMEPGYLLIAGNHRVEAARQLGWSEIDARVMVGESLEAELIEIDENLCRAELTAAQRASAIKRRKQIWEALHPSSGNSFSETQERVSVRGRVGEGRPPEFASETAAAAGMTKQAINQHLARADALGDDLDRIHGTSLDKGVEMDALKAMPEPERKELIDRAAAGEKVSARAQQVRDAEEEKPKQSSVASLADYLDRLSREIPAAMGCRSLEALGSVLDSAVCTSGDWMALEAALGKFGAVLDCIGDRVFSDGAA